MRKGRLSLFGGLVLVVVVCVSCGTPSSAPVNADSGDSAEEHEHEHGNPLAELTEAVCVALPTRDNSATGTVTFTESDGKVTVQADFTGLEPNGKHAIHIHQYGDVRKDDGTSAGGHYNPEGHPHAGPDTEDRHAGDLGNMEADENGEAQYTITVDNISIAGAHSPILGRSIVVHGGADDFTSQPSGDAGPRVAVGVIGVINPDLE